MGPGPPLDVAGDNLAGNGEAHLREAAHTESVYPVSWLGYRMRERKGRKSSPLDDIHPEVWTHEFTREFLELLWVLEKTIEGYPEQEEILEAVLGSELFEASELPDVPEELRKGPKVPRGNANQMEIWGE